MQLSPAMLKTRTRRQQFCPETPHLCLMGVIYEGVAGVWQPGFSLTFTPSRSRLSHVQRTLVYICVFVARVLSLKKASTTVTLTTLHF